MFGLVLSLAVLSVATDAGYVFRPEVKGWFHVHNYVATWDEAYAKCWNDGYGLVASPNTPELRAEIQKVIGARKTPYFLGTTSSFYPGRRFESIEGIALEDMPVADLLGGLDPQGNDCLSFDGEKIRTVPCTARLPFICYKKQDKLIPAGNPCGTRGDGYEYNSAFGKCYKLHKTATNWNASYITCAKEGGYLAVLSDEAEAKFLTELTTKQLASKEDTFVSVGLRARDGNGDWLSVLGQRVEEIYNSWRSFKPTNPENRCGSLHNSGKLQDGLCVTDRPFLCEKNPKIVHFPASAPAGPSEEPINTEDEDYEMQASPKHVYRRKPTMRMRNKGQRGLRAQAAPETVAQA